MYFKKCIKGVEYNKVNCLTDFEHSLGPVAQLVRAPDF